MRLEPSSVHRHRPCEGEARPRPAYRVLALALALGMSPAFASAAGPGGVDFSRDILPILSDHCFLCHGPDPKTRKADLRLDIKEGALREKDPVIVPGRGEESEFIRRITSTDPEEVMPPAKSGRTLTPSQVDLLKRWVDGGAKWGKHWAFEAPRRPEVPKVADAGWARNSIDPFVRQKLDAEGLRPSPEADRTTLIRRATLDLTGLPPTPKDVDRFLADPSPTAYEELVDRLLASPQYGERMAMDWLDDARFADTNGYQNDFARTMWPWRDWVIEAFNRNQPFDDFVLDQVAGDLRTGAALPQRIATGFNRNNRTVTEAGSIDEEWRVENAVDRVETTATVFLGLTMGCARCHDHKYDPISQKEFYEFLGFFNSVNEKGVYTEQRGNVPPLVSVPSLEDQAKIRRLDAAIAGAEKAVREREAGLSDRQRSWERSARSESEPAAPVDWAVRWALDGQLNVSRSEGTSGDSIYRGEGPPTWSEGPWGKALSLDGQDKSFVDAGDVVKPGESNRISYGTWALPRANGALLSKMDDPAGYRGFDLLVLDRKVVAHLVNTWPGNAIKVTTKEALPADAWTHVFLTYDGSGKAAGVTVYFNGRPVPVEVQSDRLRETIATPEPLRLGRRATEWPLKGELADVRVYRRTLDAAEVRAIVLGAMRKLAQTPEDRRSKAQEELLSRWYRETFAPELDEAQKALAKLRQEKSEAERQVPTVMVMEDTATPRETFLLKRGRYDMPDTSRKLEPGIPASLPPLPEGAPHNRLGLARWLVLPGNPLTARVMVNRMWQHHFGTGLVKTSENFGLQSEPPSHPDLLDWLASEFVRRGWDMKAMHRLIVTSATYRQSSKASADLVRRDPENRLLARGPRYRLVAEVVRDNALAVAGLLSPKVGGPSVKPYQPAGLWEELAGGAGEAPYVQDKGTELYRRSLYIYRKRTVPHPTMATFDAPSREICQVKRARTNTPLQALELLNDVTYVEAARHLAELMLATGGADPDERITFAFRRATARQPLPAELQVLRRGLERYRQAFAADRGAAESFVHHGDSPIPAGLEPSELAAYTATAAVILNLDETITLE